MKREEPYGYRGWRVHHYVDPEQYIACQEALVVRAATKVDIEAEINKCISSGCATDQEEK